MSPELLYTLLSVGGLLIGWLARHHGIPWGSATSPSASPTPVPAGSLGLELLQQLQAFLVNQQQHLQTTDVLKQMVNNLPASTPKS